MVKKKASPKQLSSSSKTSDPKAPEKIRKVLQTLGKLYPIAECALHHQSAFQLLVATILSAQCTDERVNQATPELFSLYPTAEALSQATQEDVERIVKPLGFFRNKAANIRAMAAALVDRHRGEVPESLEELVQLPGVGRKTASVVLGTWYGIPSGVVVDTHVKRLTNLLGLTKSSNPEIIERDLIALIPQTEWIMFSHRLIHHGRKVCIARRPRCTECELLPLCPRVGLADLSTVR